MPSKKVFRVPKQIPRKTIGVVKDRESFANKVVEYARLSAEKYQKQGRRTSFVKIYCSPAFSFIQNYFFKMGFRDGWKGFICAGMTAWYTFLKYANLKELEDQHVKVTNNESLFKSAGSKMNLQES